MWGPLSREGAGEGGRRTGIRDWMISFSSAVGSLWVTELLRTAAAWAFIATDSSYLWLADLGYNFVE